MPPPRNLVAEPLLKEVAEGTPNVTVRYGGELVDFAEGRSGVSVRRRSPAGAEETLRGFYLEYQWVSFVLTSLLTFHGFVREIRVG
jgi:hypothetical protein